MKSAFSFNSFINWSIKHEYRDTSHDSSIAYRLKEENSDYILAGERGGKILPGFDVGNSPCELIKLDVCGKTVVHTTSAGTQGIENAKNADIILVDSLFNAKARRKAFSSQDLLQIQQGLY